VKERERKRERVYNVREEKGRKREDIPVDK
jgi:hypothetical protein